MFIEIEDLIWMKYKINEEMQEVYTRYGLSVAWYRARKIVSLERMPELKEYIFKKEQC